MLRTNEGAPWMVEAPETQGVGTPSWLAPRRVSAAPFAFPRNTQPPVITHAPVKSSRPPEPLGQQLAQQIRSAPPSARPPAYPDLREENAALKAQLAQVAVALAAVRAETLASCEPELVRLAVAIAERVTARELATDPSLLIDWAREGLAALAATDGLVVAIAPDVAESVPEEAWKRLGEPHLLEVDPALPASSCELRAGGGRVPIAHDARLALIGAELGVPERGAR